MDTVKLDAEPRQVIGKKVKLLRRQGIVPANVYGLGRDSIAVQLGEKVVAQRVARASRSTLFSLDLNGDHPTVLVRKVQRHPTSGKVLHVDFQQVSMTETLRTSVPLHFVGEAPAVYAFQGTLMHVLTGIEVEALPGDLPAGIEVDLSKLETLDDAVHVRDLVAPKGVEVLSGADEVVARVLPPSRPEAEEPAAEAAEEGAPEAAASGAEAAEAPAESTAE